MSARTVLRLESVVTFRVSDGGDVLDAEAVSRARRVCVFDEMASLAGVVSSVTVGIAVGLFFTKYGERVRAGSRLFEAKNADVSLLCVNFLLSSDEAMVGCVGDSRKREALILPMLSGY